MEWLMQQESTMVIQNYMTRAHAEQIEKGGRAFTFLDKETKHIAASAGVIQYWPGRGEAWAVLDKTSREKFLAMHNCVKRYLDICDLNRVEATVAIDYPEGHRWMKLLGFEVEAPIMKAYRPDGKDCVLYARVGKGLGKKWL